MRIIRLALLATAVILLLAAGYLCTARVPDGSLGLRMRGGQAIDLLQPGLHASRPFDDLALLPAGPREYSGALRTRTGEGATLAVPFRLALDFSQAEPARLSSLGREVASGVQPDAAVERLLNELAKTAVSDPPGFLPEKSVAEKMVGLGLVAGSLALGPGRAAPEAGNPLMASYVRPPWPVLVIGIDSADWDVIDPLIEAGDLPNLKALRDRGAWGTLRSMKPTLSPILWTTIATGRPPEDHGVIDFLMKDPATGAEVPISRLFRRVKALWNIASDLEIPNRTIAWWATWPAERVTGEMITDRVAYSLFDLPLGEQQPGSVYPESLAKEVGELKVHEDSISYEEIRAIVDIPQAEFERARLALDSPEGYRDPLCHLIKVLASTQTYHRIAMTLLKRRPDGLSLVYFEGLDEVNHRFAHFLPPAMTLTRGSDPVLAAAFQEAVPNFYRLQDRLVGELVGAAGPGAVVMVLSDHGFAHGRERPIHVLPDIEGKPGLWHTMDGILIVAGPPVRPGRIAAPAGLLDITPTLLALMGLPTAADMPGRAIADLLEPDSVPKLPDVRMASYDQIGEPLQSMATASASPQDQEMIAKLTALGYIESGSGEGAGTGTATYHINAGLIFLKGNELDRAQEEFRRARELAPHYDQPLLGLAQVQMMRGRPAEAIPFMEKALIEGGVSQPVLLTRAAWVYARAGRRRQGLRFLETLRLEGRREAFRLTAMGVLHEGDGDPEGAIGAYRAALEVDPSVERALQGVYTLLRKQGALDQLAGILQASTGVESINVSVRAANWLALTRELQGRRAEARAILTEALSKSSDDVMTLTNLGSMLVRDDQAAEGLPYLERAYGRLPRSFEVVVNLIVAHGKLSNLEQARRFFKEGEAIARRPELYNAIAYACFLNGARQDADSYINRSLAIDPKQQDARRLKEEIDRKRAG